jgi:hypothetical protein
MAKLSETKFTKYRTPAVGADINPKQDILYIFYRTIQTNLVRTVEMIIFLPIRFEGIPPKKI